MGGFGSHHHLPRWFIYERIETAWDLIDEPLSSDPPTPEPEEPVWDA